MRDSFEQVIMQGQYDEYFPKSNITSNNFFEFKEYYDLVENQGYCISLQKIKGHAGNYGNELCDKLATGKIILDNQKNLDKFEKM